LIFLELKKLESRNFPIVKTSAKEVFGIEELVSKISIYVKKRELLDSDLSFIILGFTHKKGIGELLNVGIKSGVVELKWITDKVKVRYIFSIDDNPLKIASEGEIVQVSLNIVPNFDLGTIYYKAKFIPGKIQGLLSEINPRKK